MTLAVAHDIAPADLGALESYLREHVHAIRPKETPDA